MRVNSDEQDDLSRLLAAAREGCLEALGDALDASRQYLLLVANHELTPELRQKAGASDLVQDTLLEAHRDFRQFQGTTQPELIAWLRDILRNNVRDFYKSYLRTGKRQLSREQALPGGSETSNPNVSLATADPSPSAQAMRAEQRERVESSINRLPPDQQTVIRLRHGEGLAFDQIGQQMGRSAGAAKQLWCRAVRALTQYLAES